MLPPHCHPWTTPTLRPEGMCHLECEAQPQGKGPVEDLAGRSHRGHVSTCLSRALAAGSPHSAAFPVHSLGSITGLLGGRSRVSGAGSCSQAQTLPRSLTRLTGGTCSSSLPASKRCKVFPLVGRFQMHFITQYLLRPYPPYPLGHVGSWFHEHLLCAHYRPDQFHTTLLHF